ncbi:MAG: D-glycerate dehydrogenase [Gemmatimonadaceae bacterium]
MKQQHVFITRRIPDVATPILQAAGATFTVGQSDEEKGLTTQEILDGVKSADVVLSLLTEPITRDVLGANPRLLGIANYAVGFNNVDVAAATELGIPVSNTPGILTDTTADLSWALILGAARRIVEAHEYMVAGRYKLWGPNLFLGGDVSPGGNGKRKVLGIVGYGRIGAAVARRSIGFDMDVLAYDPHNPDAIAKDAADPAMHVRAADLDELLRESDFVSLHPLLTAETRHMIGERELNMMKPTAYLVNVSRGPVVDEAALVRALKTNVIAGAALDVFENEPLMAPGLAECRNALLVPHIASGSQDTRDRMATMAAENVVAHLNGTRAPNVVNPEVYDTTAYAARRSAASA